jgi:hypothetical protein
MDLLKSALAGLALLALAGAPAGPARAAAAAAPLAEERVKAAFLYNFAKFVDWTGKDESGSANLLMGVAGDNVTARTLEQAVQGKLLGRRPIVVRAIDDPRELAACNLVFLGWMDAPRVKQVLEALRGGPVLTVGQAPGFVQMGGMIGLFQEDNKIRFDVNLGAAERAGLKISARLLALARTVLREDGSGH